MKVVVAHNRYTSAIPSGENAVVDHELGVLERAGVDVIPYIRSSDEIGGMSPLEKATVAVGPIYARKAVSDLEEIFTTKRPDVLHIHNVYPLVSPWAIKAAHRHNIPVVLTVHNFRLDCVSGAYLRDGNVCTDCAGHRLAWPALQHGCYRGSRLQSVPMVLGRSVHRDTWTTVERMIALTSFHAEFLESLGVDADQITVRPTSTSDPGPMPPPGRDVLFVGRFGEEKGITVLLAAWAKSGAAAAGRKLQLAGSGELNADVTAAAQRDPSIVLHGPASADQVQRLMRDAGVVAIPSTCFEGLPRVLVESFSMSRPVMASAIGGLGRTITEASGWPIAPGDVDAWATVLTDLDDHDIAKRGLGARAQFDTEFQESVTTPILLAAYESAIGSRAR